MKIICEGYEAVLPELKLKMEVNEGEFYEILNRLIKEEIFKEETNLAMSDGIQRYLKINEFGNSKMSEDETNSTNSDEIRRCLKMK